MVEVVLIQCNLVHNQYQRKSEILSNFVPNKSYSYLLKVELSNLLFLKTSNTEFDDNIIINRDKNGRLYTIEDKLHFTLLANK